MFLDDMPSFRCMSSLGAVAAGAGGRANGHPPGWPARQGTAGGGLMNTGYLVEWRLHIAPPFTQLPTH